MSRKSQKNDCLLKTVLCLMLVFIMITCVIRTCTGSESYNGKGESVPLPYTHGAIHFPKDGSLVEINGLPPNVYVKLYTDNEPSLLGLISDRDGVAKLCAPLPLQSAPYTEVMLSSVVSTVAPYNEIPVDRLNLFGKYINNTYPDERLKIPMESIKLFCSQGSCTFTPMNVCIVVSGGAMGVGSC